MPVWGDLFPEFRAWVHEGLGPYGDPPNGGVAMVSPDGAKVICGLADFHPLDRPCGTCDHRETCPVQFVGAASSGPTTHQFFCSPEHREMPAYTLVRLGGDHPGGAGSALAELRRIARMLNGAWPRFLDAQRRGSELQEALLQAEGVSRLMCQGASSTDVLAALTKFLGGNYHVVAWVALLRGPAHAPMLCPGTPQAKRRTALDIITVLSRVPEYQRGDFFPVYWYPDLLELVKPVLVPTQTPPAQFADTGVFSIPILTERSDAHGRIERSRVLFIAIAGEGGPPSTDLERMRVVAQLALATSDNARRDEQLREAVREMDGFEGLVGKSQAMAEVRMAITRAARHDRTVLLVGEQGTGKEVVARLIHKHSERSQLRFISERLAEELRIVFGRVQSFYPSSTSRERLMQAEFCNVPGLRLVDKQEDAKRWEPADAELASAIADQERRLPKNSRQAYRSLVRCVWVHWHENPLFNFLEFDSGAFDTANIASELFGVPAERYTGVQGAPGRFQVASHCGGTLFLDNIHHLPLQVQRALLKATEVSHSERSVTRSGAAPSEPIHVRIIAASTQDLLELVTEEEFSAELCSRLMVEVIRIPPLRERRDDIPLLAAYFAGQLGRHVAEDAVELLAAQDWRDSNVRGLRVAIESAASRTDSSMISRRDVEATLWSLLPNAPACEMGEEERMIRTALETHHWKVSAAAKAIRWSRQKLYRMMAKYGIQKPEA